MKESQLSPAWDEGVARWDSRARTLLGHLSCQQVMAGTSLSKEYAEHCHWHLAAFIDFITVC